MAGDWIKMRTALLTSPKVNGIARFMEEDGDVSRALTTGYSGPLHEVVTRNVTRYVAVTALLLVWGAANEHTSDGIFLNADLSDIDDIAGIPSFGRAMESVGWASFDPDSVAVTLPNFNEYNTSGKVRSSGGADRQRKYRERKAAELEAKRYASGDVTRDVTVTEREEKRREEKKEKKPAPSAVDLFPNINPQVVSDFKALRKAKHAAITQTAVDGIRREATKAGMTLEAAMAMCCERGWAGFKAEWLGGAEVAAAAVPGGGRARL